MKRMKFFPLLASVMMLVAMSLTSCKSNKQPVSDAE